MKQYCCPQSARAPWTLLYMRFIPLLEYFVNMQYVQIFTEPLQQQTEVTLHLLLGDQFKTICYRHDRVIDLHAHEFCLYVDNVMLYPRIQHIYDVHVCTQSIKWIVYYTMVTTSI